MRQPFFIANESLKSANCKARRKRCTYIPDKKIANRN